MRKVHFATDSFYHIYNRGVDKRKIFHDKRDYYRFLHELFELNNMYNNYNIRRTVEGTVRGSTSNINPRKPQKQRLVDIICFCLMPNHFHLMLRQRVKNGISKFMQKLGTGYTMYFNQKHQRSGSLFENRFKAVFIETDEYLIHLSRYIHLNPIELRCPKWKEEGIHNHKVVNEFLDSYRWSSYLDYIGIRNFPSIINQEFIYNYFPSISEYKRFVNDLLLNVNDVDEIAGILLE